LPRSKNSPGCRLQRSKNYKRNHHVHEIIASVLAYKFTIMKPDFNKLGLYYLYNLLLQNAIALVKSDSIIGHNFLLLFNEKKRRHSLERDS
jgi:hypothetical protein